MLAVSESMSVQDIFLSLVCNLGLNPGPPSLLPLPSFAVSFPLEVLLRSHAIFWYLTSTDSTSKQDPNRGYATVYSIYPPGWFRDTSGPA